MLESLQALSKLKQTTGSGYRCRFLNLECWMVWLPLVKVFILSAPKWRF